MNERLSSLSAIADCDQWLRKLIASHDRQSLPSIKSLAAQRSVAMRVMHLAVRKLARQGLLLIRPGKPTRIISRMGALGVSRLYKRPRRILYEKIRQSLTEGTIRIGEELPKAGYYAIEERLSGATVCRTLKLLEKEGFIHKKGKRWIAGKDVRPKKQLSPSIMLAVYNYEAWRNFLLQTMDFSYPLMHEIQSELERHGYAIKPVFIERYDSQGARIQRAKQDIESLLKSLGSNYRGAVILLGSADHALILRLLSLHQPVVAFEEYFHCPANPLWREYYLFLRNDFQAGVRMMLQAFANKGHRVIAVPLLTRPSLKWWTTWIPERVEMIAEESKRISPRIQVRVIEQDEDFWYEKLWYNNDESFESTLNGMIAARADGRTPVREILKKLSPSLSSIIGDSRITALLAPNDNYAHIFSMWLKEYGISIPKDLSLAGFDNNILSRYYYGFDTIDWGLARLGYLGAHAIIGDLPLKIRSDRSIMGSCVYIDRGSIAAIAR